MASNSIRVFFKIFNESVTLALQELRVNRVRAILSVLGISIGIFCVIVIFAAVDSLQNNIESSIKKLGENVLYIERWPWDFNSDYPWWKYMNRPIPKYTEMQEIQQKIKGADAVAIAVYLGDKTIKYRSFSAENVNIAGVSSDYDRVQDMEFGEGRYFTPNESLSGENEIILGATLAETLFPGSNIDPVGQQVEFQGRRLTVIGVFKKQGESILNNSLDDQAMVPFNFVKKMVSINGINGVEPVILVKASQGMPLDELKAELTGIMRSIHSELPSEDDNFAINKISMITNLFSSLFGVADIAGIIIGGFAILVGGFGIANIMFVSVKERTNIIGIKKAIGAKSYFILLEFLIESVILCIIGGIIGILLVYITTVIASHAMNFDFVLSAGNITEAMVISAVIGIIAGFWPALSAARLDPVVAIRSK
jgi:putative ABC transport system permease protein